MDRNVLFFYKLNNLLKSYIYIQNDINCAINCNAKYNTKITEKEQIIIDKWNKINNFFNASLDNINLISTDLTKYLIENCNHEWTTDNIDIDPDHSTLIRYCEHCFTSENECTSIKN